MPTDSSGHEYVEVQNVRVTFVAGDSRSPESNWAGTDVLRIQAYRSERDKSMHTGAEIPIRSPSDLGAFVAAIVEAYAAGSVSQS